MKKVIFVSSVLTVALSMSGCERSKTETDIAPKIDVQTQINKTEASQPKAATTEIPAVWAKSYKMDVVNPEICQAENEENMANCTIYDVQSIKTNVDWINQYYDAALKEMYAESAFGKKSTLKLEGEDADRQYYEGSMVSFNNQQYQLVTFSTYHNSYSGGAHNHFNMQYDVFDLKTQKKLVLNDILKPVAKDKVLALLKSYNQTELEEYQTDLTSLALTDNFYFGSNGLVFVYAPYEIAAWVFGSPELSIPYDELKDFIKPEYLPNQPDYRIGREFS